MEVTIFIDVLWLRTFFVELNVCIFVNLWMKQMRPVARILWVCALIVSLETLLFVVAGYGFLFAIGSMTLRVLLLKLLFFGVSRGMFLRLFLWTMAATVAMGGILGACQEHLPQQYWFPLGCILCALCVLLSLLLEERRTQHDNNLYRMQLCHDGNVSEVIGLHDTGNRLLDPFMHAPVQILARSEAQMLGLKPECRRLIPFSTVGKTDGLMEVWTIDAMKWTGGRLEHVVIGIADDVLFEGKDYRMILSAGWKDLS